MPSAAPYREQAFFRRIPSLCVFSGRPRKPDFGTNGMLFYLSRWESAVVLLCPPFPFAAIGTHERTDHGPEDSNRLLAQARTTKSRWIVVLFRRAMGSRNSLCWPGTGDAWGYDWLTWGKNLKPIGIALMVCE